MTTAQATAGNASVIRQIDTSAADSPGCRVDDRRRCLQSAAATCRRGVARRHPDRLGDHRHRHDGCWPSSIRASPYRKPDLNAVPTHTPARVFGTYIGFQSALGLLDQRLPGQCRLCGRDLRRARVLLAAFGDGNNLPSIIGASIRAVAASHPWS